MKSKIFKQFFSMIIASTLLLTGVIAKRSKDTNFKEGSERFNTGKADVKISTVNTKNPHEFKARRILAICFIAACFIAFGTVLANAQIKNSAEYSKANASTTETSVVKATRGEILDRNGNVLVANKQGNSIVFDATKFPTYKNQEERNKIILSLINLFEKNDAEWVDVLPITINSSGKYAFTSDSEKEIETMESQDMLDLNNYATADDCMYALIEKYSLQNYSKSDARKIASVCYNMRLNVFNTASTYTFAEDVDSDIVAYIKENSNFYKGVTVEISTYREYTDGTLAPHILGMVGAIDADEYADLKAKGYAMDAVIGKSGIESAEETYLKGSDGIKSVTTNSDGTTETTYTKEVVNGSNIVLTLDSGLQKAAQKALKEKCDSVVSQIPHGGSVVVMNVNTGEVLAMATYPSYDISTYKENYKALAADSSAPLWNRATQSTVAPGSTAKVSTAIAALEEGTITKDTVITCHGYYNYLGMTFKCSSGHGIDGNNMTVARALRDSCNIFFDQTAQRLGIDKLNTYREMLGLGQKTGIEIAENVGVLDSPSYRASIGDTWLPGFTLQSGIGQAGNLFTPLQLCNYIATVANGGTRYSAHLVKEVKSFNYSKNIVENNAKVVCNCGFSASTIDTVQSGMRMVVTQGGCRQYLNNLKVDVCAKTGTAQVTKKVNGTYKTLTNGFNVSFAPYDNPEISIAVAIEGASSGASCAPVAKAIYEYYYSSTKQKSEDAQEFNTVIE